MLLGRREPAMSPATWRASRWLIVASMVLLVGWIGSATLVVHRLTRRERPPFPEAPPEIGWGRIEEHRLATSDGEELEAWLVRGPPEGPSVVVLHGKGGSCAASLGRAELLAELGASPLVISLRAHGSSSGDVEDFGWSARNDVRAAVDFLEGRRPGCPILVLATSLGAAAAAFAAPELGERVRGYALEQPYRDLRSATWHRLQEALPPLLDRVAYAGMLLVGPVFFGNLDRFSAADSLRGLPDAVGLWVLAGEADALATPDEARAVAAAHPSASRVVLFPGAGHDSLLLADGALYRRTIADWVAEALGAR